MLVDPSGSVVLRAHEEADLPAIVEQCRDPEMQRFTTVPTPFGGYGLAEARAFFEGRAAGWHDGRVRAWAVEAPVGTANDFAGSVSLVDEGDGVAEVAFGLHPAARGRGLMSAAVRLLRDYAFDVADLRVLRWRAVVGNWGSRRAAAAAGFRFDGTVRSLLVHRGEPLDGWIATLSADDPRLSRNWPDPPRLTGSGLVLRPFAECDVVRIAEACSDRRTRQWLVSLPDPYTLDQARAYLETTREAAAQGTALGWCVADPDDRCLGSISLEGFGGYSRRAEIGYWTHPDARGRGVLTAAVRLVTAYAEDTDLVDSIVIRCAEGNAASRHVAEAAGFALVGTLPASEPLGDGTLADLLSYARPGATAVTLG